MKRSILIILAAVALAAGCGPRSGRSTDPAAKAADMRDFPTVKTPDVYSENKDRQRFLAEHFWDRFFSEREGMVCDSFTVYGVPTPVLEEAFSGYVAVLQSIDIATAKEDIGAFFDRIESAQREDIGSNVYEVFGLLMDRYLYDPNSPFRNEDLYQPYVEKLSKSKLTSPDMAPAFANEARLCALNPIGSPAADFRFTDSNGVTRHLHDVNALHTLLLFSNPGCTACEDLVNSIKSIRNIDRKISMGRLAIVNVYIDDDLNAWRQHLPGFPRNWYNGYDTDHVIRRDLIYNIRGIPSLYILDKDKRVVMKDAPEENVLRFLDSIRAE